MVMNPEMAFTDSAMLKLQRAGEHMAMLNNEVLWWQHQDSYGLRGETNEERTEHTFYFVMRREPDYGRWGCILGDIVHNFRSALDHIIAAMWTDDDTRRQSEWPIFADDAKFAETIKSGAKAGQPTARSGLAKIQRVPDERVREFIASQQPCNRSAAPKADLLWLLQCLDIADKHRAIHPMFVAPIGLQWQVECNWRGEAPSLGEEPFIAIPSGKPLEHDVLVSTVTTARPADVKINTQLAAAVAIDLRTVDDVEWPELSFPLSRLPELANEVGNLFIHVSGMHAGHI